VNHIIRRAFAAAAVTATGAVGLAAPAYAHHSDLGCESAVVTAALDSAKADVRAAQTSFTAHTKTSVHALVKQVKAQEKAEAEAADKKADRLAAKADKVTGKEGKEARAAAKVARTLARVEAKEAARLQRASFAELRKVVKADRRVLKAEWDAAKVALSEVKVHAEACAEAPVTEEPVTEEPVTEEPVTEEPVTEGQ
jgi:ribosomal protein L19E